MKQSIILLVLFFCHWLADYTPLSRPYMLEAKRFGKPLTPIFEHAGTHMLLMLACMFFFTDNSGLIVSLALFQLITHFFIDVLKGRVNGWFPAVQNPAKSLHWIVFGLDQSLHAVVIIIMSYFLTK